MKTKSSAPSVVQTIKVTIEGKQSELSREDALTLFNALKKALNIADTIIQHPYPVPQWSPPVVIERPIVAPDPFYNPPYRITCGDGMGNYQNSSRIGSSSLYS